MKNKSLFYWAFAKALVLYLAWLGIYHTWGSPKGGFDDQLTHVVGVVSAAGMELIGYDMTGSGTGTHWRQEKADEGETAYMLHINGSPAVSVGNRCNGLYTMMLYIGFLIVYPGRLPWKTVFIIGGTVILFFSNIVRIIALAINWLYWRESFDFNHKYTYLFTLYAIVFVLWMVWVEKYSYISENRKEAPATSAGK